MISYCSKARAKAELRRAVMPIREHMAAMGYDLSEVSDEEIRDGVLEFGRIAASTGVTAQQAGAALMRIGTQLAPD